MDLITLLLALAVILYLGFVFNKNKARYSNFPPGPTPLPIIGNALSLDLSKPHRAFLELSKTYGTVFSVQIGFGKLVVLCGYETIKDALVNHADEFSDRPKIELFSTTTKDHGLIFANGENWKVMRRFTLSTLRDYGMGKKGIEHKIMDEASSLVQAFKAFEGKPFDNLKIINTAVANIIVSTVIGVRYDYEDPTITKLISLINENIRLLGTPLVRLYNSYPHLIHWMPGPHKKVFVNMKEMHDFIRATFTKQKKELDVNDQRNLVDAYLAKQQEGKSEHTQYFHDENLIALVENLFTAGMETTSTTLRWGLLLMMKYPEIQRKVHNEIEAVIGSAQPQIEHRKQMPYTDAVIHEIQRFGDIVPGSAPHVTSRDVTFRGYSIPKGTVIIPLLHSVLRDKAYFEKPNEFYPEHFLDSEGKLRKIEAFIPFSIGKRSCAGETLALMELFLFFTTLLQNFNFQAPPGAILDLNPAMASTNGPKQYEIRAIPRN
ncbi:cytochrome P450 2K1-like [Ranitomeya variabilis]|uniref:cytochrome P450 2K1-like n=1 Tax=Ranitomeya variabilis TaxID=490064 RepID=UPI0040563DAC